MNRRIGLALLGLVALLPGAALAEAFDVNFCWAGTYSFLHRDKSVPPVFVYEGTGMFLKAAESPALHGASVHCAGYQVGRRDKRFGDAVCKLVDTDGDFIIAGTPFQGLGSTYRFLFGTGKYQGIHGSGKSRSIVRGKRVAPGTFQRCTRITGTFEIAK